MSRTKSIFRSVAGAVARPDKLVVMRVARGAPELFFEGPMECREIVESPSIGQCRNGRSTSGTDVQIPFDALEPLGSDVCAEGLSKLRKQLVQIADGYSELIRYAMR